ncbi:MAG: hypothetical protein NTZ75_07410 [Euryarchaeota archaeon]|nr:hypothetical protein [Euryarchaeota archaeon]
MKKKEIQEMIDHNGIIDVYERKINSNGSVFVSASNKRDVRGCPVLVIVMNKDNGGKSPVETKGGE